MEIFFIRGGRLVKSPKKEKGEKRSGRIEKTPPLNQGRGLKVLVGVARLDFLVDLGAFVFEGLGHLGHALVEGLFFIDTQ